MGMAPALAAGGPVQRRKGVRAGRAEAAAMEEEQAVWIRRPRALERRCEMDYRRASKGPRGALYYCRKPEAVDGRIGRPREQTGIVGL